jgi:hypothetical protein
VKRLARFILNTLTFLSLLVFLAFAALWLRSHHVRDLVDLVTENTYTLASTNPGELNARISFNYPFAFYASGPPPRFVRIERTIDAGYSDWKTVTIPTAITDWRHAGIVYLTWDSGDATRKIPTALVVLPLWLPTVTFALLPVSRGLLLLKRRSRRGHRDRANLCQACGYDLRATPDRCPECGAIPQASFEAPLREATKK